MKNLRRFVWIFVIIALGNVACENNDDIIVDESLLNQTVYADEEEGKSSVQFTTTTAWTSSINYTRSTAANWLSISPSRGDAGTHTITISLEPNLTGIERTAVITITSGRANIEIRVTQQGEKEDGTLPEGAISRVSQFVYDGMAMFYLWNEQMLDREPTPADTDPVEYFRSLLHPIDTLNRWSWITDDVNSLLNDFSGAAASSFGFSPAFLWLPNGIHLVGAVRYVYQGTAAQEVGIRRGDIITEINGRPITPTNAPLLLEGNARITLTVFDQNFLNPREVSITPRPSPTNPVLHSSIHEIEGRRIGYLFYTAFRSNFNEELFEVFRKFQQAGITDLVLDLRYNPGGDVSAAVYLASLIAPRDVVQNRSVFTVMNYNRFINEVFDRQGTDRSTLLGTFNNRFSNPIDANLDLDNVFIIATRSSASASELITFCLRPYMNVVHIGELTSGKYTASWTVHAFDNFTEHGVARAQRVYNEADLTAVEKDKLRNWAMQPIVAEFQNARNESFAATNGLVPNYPIAWLGHAPHTWRQIGDKEDYLFAKAISLITGLPYDETPLRSASDIQLRSTELRSSAEERLRRAVNLDNVEPVEPEILRQILLDFEF